MTFKILRILNIAGTVEDTNFKFIVQFDYKELYTTKNAKLRDKRGVA